MDKLVYITRNITFDDLNSGRKSPIDVYEEQMYSWIFNPIKQLSYDKENSFENGYAMFSLELLFFEPHGKYLSKNNKGRNREFFEKGFHSFLDFSFTYKFIEEDVLEEIKSINFYGISRCGIFHNMTIEPGLLIDSTHMERELVFYNNPINNKLLVSPWNFLNVLEKYFYEYIQALRSNKTDEKYKNFDKTFKSLFRYKEN